MTIGDADSKPAFFAEYGRLLAQGCVNQLLCPYCTHHIGSCFRYMQYPKTGGSSNTVESPPQLSPDSGDWQPAPAAKRRVAPQKRNLKKIN